MQCPLKLPASWGHLPAMLQNQEPMLGIIKKHASAAENLADNFDSLTLPGQNSGNQITGREKLIGEATNVWQKALALGEKHGFRNSQVTVLAPTGTIAFLMDCDTTGLNRNLP